MSISDINELKSVSILLTDDRPVDILDRLAAAGLEGPKLLPLVGVVTGSCRNPESLRFVEGVKAVELSRVLSIPEDQEIHSEFRFLRLQVRLRCACGWKGLWHWNVRQGISLAVEEHDQHIQQKEHFHRLAAGREA